VKSAPAVNRVRAARCAAGGPLEDRSGTARPGAGEAVGDTVGGFDATGGGGGLGSTATADGGSGEVDADGSIVSAVTSASAETTSPHVAASISRAVAEPRADLEPPQHGVAGATDVDVDLARRLPGPGQARVAGASGHLGEEGHQRGASLLDVVVDADRPRVVGTRRQRERRTSHDRRGAHAAEPPGRCQGHRAFAGIVTIGCVVSGPEAPLRAKNRLVSRSSMPGESAVFRRWPSRRIGFCLCLHQRTVSREIPTTLA
jgi:hypothetical protein